MEISTEFGRAEDQSPLPPVIFPNVFHPNLLAILCVSPERALETTTNAGLLPITGMYGKIETVPVLVYPFQENDYAKVPTL